MDSAAYLAATGRDGHRLATAAEGQLAAPVPSCPDWAMADLVHHLGGVLTQWTALGTGRLGPEEIRPTPRPPDDELVEWFRGAVDEAVDGLATVDPGAERWNWTGRDFTAGWIQRRVAQETAMHCWDGLHAVGAGETLETIEAELAADGIDEFLDVFVGVLAPALTGEAGSLHVHVTGDQVSGDASRSTVPGEWLLEFGPGRAELTRAHAKGDAALRGPASDVLLVLWQRRGIDELEEVDVVGDVAVLDRLLDQARF